MQDTGPPRLGLDMPGLSEGIKIRDPGSGVFKLVWSLTLLKGDQTEAGLETPDIKQMILTKMFSVKSQNQ